MAYKGMAFEMSWISVPMVPIYSYGLHRHGQYSYGLRDVLDLGTYT